MTANRRHRARILIAAAGVISVACIAVAGAADASGSSHAAGRAAVSAAPDASAQACVDAGGVVCDPSAPSVQELKGQAFAQVPSPDAKLISRAAAEAQARAVVATTMGVSAATLAAAPTFSAEMTGTEFTREFEVPRSANVDESRPVWVISVHASIRTDGVAKTSIKDWYSAVIDAQSGIITDGCIGCGWLSESR